MAGSLWRDRRFASFWAGETISQFGDRISELALPLIAVTLLAATPIEVGLLIAAIWAPNLLSVVVGAWVDRQAHRRRLLVLADLLRAAALFSLPVAYWLGALGLPQLFGVALLAGAGQVLFSCSYQSFFVTLVDRDRYVDANSKLSTSRSASFVAGPAAGGFLIQALTAPVAILVDAVSFLFSALLISRIRTEPFPVGQKMSLVAGVSAGLRYVLGHRYLRAALACVTTVNFFGFVAQALVILYASRELGLPAGPIGLAFGLGATGALLGAVIAPRLSARYGVGRMVVAGAILFPAPVAAIALAGGPQWLIVTIIAMAEAVSGAGVMFLDINLNSVQTAVIADDMRSRVSGVFGTINYGARPLGAVIGGLLGSSLGLRPTLLIAAAGGVLSCLWLLRSPIPSLRSLESLTR
ncbi:MFS transporter [Actinoplanes derwentensis]|uniref:Predicted arabinose efflux permease, MFS family n=1 Tax=Actinoplanes derwentensis TaxID=113562 RepID=A0A1H1U9G2_9ACTN|nr:MFS transporter [Actinoplanes derwentensis]GID85240.1 MFS transporter [Actinoplanes derwentensis]SDS69155.1 Predicted arabinose efflux permease, MFS family [Actinoplanes derwentensis]